MAFRVDDALAIAGIVATLAAIGTSVGSSAAGKKEKTKQQNYQDKLKTIQDIDDKEAQQGERKKALGRLVGGSAAGSVPGSTDPLPQAPKAGTQASTLSGVSGALGSAGQLAGNLSSGDWRKRYSKWSN